MHNTNWHSERFPPKLARTHPGAPPTAHPNPYTQPPLTKLELFTAANAAPAATFISKTSVFCTCARYHQVTPVCETSTEVAYLYALVGHDN